MSSREEVVAIGREEFAQAAGTRNKVLSTNDRQHSRAVRLQASKGSSRFELYVLLRQQGSHASHMCSQVAVSARRPAVTLWVCLTIILPDEVGSGLLGLHLSTFDPPLA
jgi:hypothetical protein